MSAELSDHNETGRRTPIFDDFERSNTAPAGHEEPTFSFLNRVSGEYWEQVRTLIQEWADRISVPKEYEEIRSRFCAANDFEFRSTFLELYLHQCLINAGYSVTIHPDTPGSTRHPDFLAERDGTGFYLEAISPGTSSAARGKAARTGQFYDAVNKVKNDNFFIWVTELNTGTKSAPTKKLRGALNSWLSSLDPDELEAEPELWSTHSWSSDDGWSASFKAIPKSVDKRGEPTRTVGVYPVTVQRVDDAPKILAAIKEKHKAYGNLEFPYIIAVGVYIMPKAREDTANALYGYLSHVLTFSDSGEVIEETPIRNSSGYFGTPESWKNRQVSAILLVNQLMPYYFQKADVELWRHPDSERPLADDLALPWSEIVFSSGLNELPARISPVDFFDLPEEWPTGHPWR
ncbi:hypothetical protein [Nocardia salmonicida]|uniref:hypothetical protein n=1 Tax=Nocardia salmonicida TaxID=53431 RepID=UPI0033E68B90